MNNTGNTKEDMNPLKYIGCRLSTSFDRTFLNQFRLQTGRTSFHHFLQQTFKKSTDCTLSQLDAIYDHLSNTLGTAATFYPNRTNLLRRVPPEVTIKFNSFQDFCSMFGTVDYNELNDFLWKWKYDKSTTARVGVRMIGVYICHDTLRSKPSFLIPGHTPFQKYKEVTVLLRDNIEWDEVEGIFQEGLRMERLSMVDMREKLSVVYGTDGDAPSSMTQLSFGLKWVPEITPSPSSVFSPTGQRGEVLGTLTATIPYVLIRGSCACEEIFKLL